jgi:hypothetical protein
MDLIYIWRYNSYLTENTVILRQRKELVNAVQENISHLLWE